MANDPSSPVVRLPLTEAGPGGDARATGITAATIRAVVADFYRDCRADATLGPIFERQVSDWPEHLAKIESFWSSAILKAGTYSGRPLEAHLAIPGLAPEHFSIWLKLFGHTVNSHCGPDDAAVFMAMAGRMARVIIANAELRRPAPDQ